MVEDIITALSKLRWFFVIARNSSFAYKGRAVDVKQVGRELGVRYVLEGSVRKGGNRLRITAQLVEAETGNHVWAERYDRDLGDIFAVQDEITERVVAAIEPELYAAEHIRSQRKPPESLDAWECVIRALSGDRPGHPRREYRSRGAVPTRHRDRTRLRPSPQPARLGADAPHGLVGRSANGHARGHRRGADRARPRRPRSLGTFAYRACC